MIGAPTFRLFTTCDRQGGRADELERLFASLRAAASAGHEIRHYLLMQRCDDAERAGVEAAAPAFTTVLADPGRLSLSSARNRLLDRFAAEVGEDDVVAFPDDDAWYPAGLVGWVGAAFQDAPDLDLLFCRYGSAPRSPAVGDVGTEAGVATLLRYASSNTIFARGRAVRAAGGFDEDLGVGARHGGGEDTDYALKLKRAGRRRRFVDAVLVGHRDPFTGLRARYYRGSLAAIARNARGQADVQAQLVRKLLVGGYLVLRREHALGDWLRETRLAFR